MKRIAIAVVSYLAFCTSVIAGDLRAGVAVCEITPPLGGPLWGYASRHEQPSVGIRDPLFARCLVLNDGAEKVAIFALDLGRPPCRSQSRAIREKLHTLKFNHTMMVATHTHNGPVLELDIWPDAHNPYNRYLENKLCDLALVAERTARPARLGFGSKSVPLNRNRHSKKADAPIDHELIVVKLEGTDSKLIATVVNFAAHPTMLPASLCELSADYPGVLAKRVEQQSGAPCLFLQGAAGEMCANPPAGVSGPEGFGDALANEVVSIQSNIHCSLTNARLQGAHDDFQFRAALNVNDPLVKASLGRAFFPNLVDFYANEYRDGVRAESTAIMIGNDIALVGFSGEMFCGHSLSLKRRAGMQCLLVCGYCNDYQQYFPTIEAMAEGGYGATPPVAMAEPGAGERMTDRALIQMLRMRGLIAAP